jgi:serine/threonine protein kinase
VTTIANATDAKGTPLFMAPEYSSEETGPTPESDVFAFGMYHFTREK